MIIFLFTLQTFHRFAQANLSLALQLLDLLSQKNNLLLIAFLLREQSLEFLPRLVKLQS